MPANAIVLVMDRLQAGYLGPYGNNSVLTPAWNALAAESLLLENHVAASNHLTDTYRAWWGGEHVWSAPSESAQPPPLPEALENEAIHAVLITDEPSLLEHPYAERFAERIVVQPEGDPLQAANEVEESHLSKVLETALRWLEEKPPQPFLLWIHTRAMAGPWDAPYEMRQELADEEDPNPPREVEPPQQELPADYDPDQLLGHTQAYSAQVTLGDMCLGMFLEQVGELRASRHALLACTSPRGYPLGEHRLVGTGRELLTTEAMHTPLLIRFPKGEAAAVRERAIVQPAHLHATLWDWFALPPQSPNAWQQSFLPIRSGELAPAEAAHVLVSDSHWALRTAQWLLVIEREELLLAARTEPLQLGISAVALYAKPDDRWDFNNVASLCQREVHELAEQLIAIKSTFAVDC